MSIKESNLNKELKKRLTHVTILNQTESTKHNWKGKSWGHAKHACKDSRKQHRCLRVKGVISDDIANHIIGFCKDFIFFFFSMNFISKQFLTHSIIARKFWRFQSYLLSPEIQSVALSRGIFFSCFMNKRDRYSYIWKEEIAGPAYSTECSGYITGEADLATVLQRKELADLLEQCLTLALSPIRFQR